MQLTIPTGVSEYMELDEAASPSLTVSRDKHGVPRWVAVGRSGACESFDTLDGALLFATGLIDVRGEDGDVQRALYDKDGMAKAWFAELLRKFETTPLKEWSID